MWMNYWQAKIVSDKSDKCYNSNNCNRWRWTKACATQLKEQKRYSRRLRFVHRDRMRGRVRRIKIILPIFNSIAIKFRQLYQMCLLMTIVLCPMQRRRWFDTPLKLSMTRKTIYSSNLNNSVRVVNRKRRLNNSRRLTRV